MPKLEDITTELDKISTELRTADDLSNLMRKAQQGLGAVADFYIRLQEIADAAKAQEGRLEMRGMDLGETLDNAFQAVSNLEEGLSELLSDARDLSGELEDPSTHKDHHFW